MFSENKFLEKFLSFGRKIIPKEVFKFFQPLYHKKLSFLGALLCGFPSKSLKVIAVTGTKGKSTTVFMISKIFEDAGLPVAAVGSLGFKIKDRTWPNTLKMTMPGRMKLQRFLKQAKNTGARYVVLEATSEGIAQGRLSFVSVDCAIFTNLHREHLESHGSFENYFKAKQKLFQGTKNIQILNIDDPHFEKFANFRAGNKLTYGRQWGAVNLSNYHPSLKILGDFNLYNALAALAAAKAYGLDMERAVKSLESIETVPGRMETFRAGSGALVIVDYAHTPDSLEAVYRNLKPDAGKLICVLGAAGGGRDKWKRPEFGRIASQYCDQIILTNEDPFDENPEEILDQIAVGIGDKTKMLRILDRKKAIGEAIKQTSPDDTVIITGKGSETSMALAGGKKIPWSDKEIVVATSEN